MIDSSPYQFNKISHINIKFASEPWYLHKKEHQHNFFIMGLSRIVQEFAFLFLGGTCFPRRDPFSTLLHANYHKQHSSCWFPVKPRNVLIYLLISKQCRLRFPRCGIHIYSFLVRLNRWLTAHIPILDCYVCSTWWQKARGWVNRVGCLAGPGPQWVVLRSCKTLQDNL